MVKIQETMATRINKMSGFPSSRILVGSLENLPTKIMLPNEEGDFIEQKVDFAGLPRQCFSLSANGTLSQELSKEKC